MDLEKSLKVVSDEYEYEIKKLNKIYTDKEEDFMRKINKKSTENNDFEREIAEANLYTQELQSKCEFYKEKNKEYDQFFKDYDCKIQILENQIKNLNLIIANKEKIIFGYEEKINSNKDAKNIKNFDYLLNKDRCVISREDNNHNYLNQTPNLHFSNKTSNAFNIAHSNGIFYNRDETEEKKIKNQIKEKGKFNHNLSLSKFKIL